MAAFLLMTYLSPYPGGFHFEKTERQMDTNKMADEFV